MTRPKVTIMIPTYNQEGYIEQCIASAMAQNYVNLEILVSDDASTDKTVKVLQGIPYDARVRKNSHTLNLGRVANYQWCLKNASGDLVLNLDGDDYLTNPSFVSECVKAWERTPNCVMVMGQAYSHMDGEPFENAILMNNGKFRPAPILNGNEFLYVFPPFKGFGPIHMATLYDRKRALELGGYRLNILSSDFDLLYRIGLSSSDEPSRHVAFIPVVAGVWRQHKDNTSRNVTVDDCISDLQMFRRVAHAYEETKYLYDWEFEAWRSQAAFHAVMPYAVLLARTGRARDFWRVWRVQAECEPGLWGQLIWSLPPRAWRYVRKHMSYPKMAVRALFPNWGKETLKASLTATKPQLESFVLAVMWMGVACMCFSLQIVSMQLGYLKAASMLSLASMIGAMNVPLSLLGSSINQMARRIAQGIRDFTAHVQRLRTPER